MGANRLAHGRLPGTQERIDVPFKADGRGEGGGISRSQRLGLLQVGTGIGVSRFHRQGKAQVGGGVFVAAINLCFFRQGREPAENSVSPQNSMPVP